MLAIRAEDDAGVSVDRIAPVELAPVSDPAGRRIEADLGIVVDALAEAALEIREEPARRLDVTPDVRARPRAVVDPFLSVKPAVAEEVRRVRREDRCVQERAIEEPGRQRPTRWRS